MTQLLCFLPQLKGVRLADVCPDSDGFSLNSQPQQRCLMVAGTVTLCAELPPSTSLLLLKRLAGSPVLQKPAQQVLDVSRDKAPLLQQSSGSAHTDVAANLASWGGKNQESPSCLWQFPAAVPAGSWQLAPGVRGLVPSVLGNVSPGCLQTV